MGQLPVPIVVVVFTKLRTTRDNPTPHLPGIAKEYISIMMIIDNL